MGLFDQFPYSNIHELNLDWVLSKLKQQGIILDNLDQMIADEVKDQLDELNLSEIIINILSQYGAVINVKDPGHDLTAAKGDGVSDDTKALQAIIAYAEQNDLPLLFYNGTFMAKSLNITDCSFIGTDAQLMKIGNTPDPLIYCTGRFTAYGLRINGNLTGQSDPEPTIQMIGASEVSLLDCEIDGGSSCIVGDISECLRIQNCSLNQYTEYAVDVEGTGFLQCNGCKTDNIASGGALRFMRIGTSNSVVADFVSMASVQIGFEFTGDFNTVSAKIPNTENHVNDGGQNNSYFFFGNEEKKVLNGNKLETVSGDVTENYGDHNENCSHCHITAKNDIELDAADVILNPTNPVTYKTPTKLSDFFNSVPAKDQNGNAYNILVEGEKIEDIGIGRSIALSEIENKTAAGINAVIASGEYDSLIIDTDLDLDAPINGVSNFSIIGGGGVIKTAGQAIIGAGEVGALIGTGTYTGNVLSGVSGLSAGDVVFLKGTTNLFDRSTLSPQWCLGTGTSGAEYSTVYNSNVATVLGTSGDGVVLDVAQDWGGGNYNVYHYTPIINFKVVGVQIESTSSLRVGTIRIENALNCAVIGCNIRQYSGSAIVLSNNDNGVIDRCYCYISQVWNAEIDHSRNNIVRLLGCRNCTIQNSQFNNGTQCLDITYTGETGKINSNTVSKYCHVRKNLCHSNYTGLTTHPGTFGCEIDGNSFYCIQGDGVSIRGAAHSITNNYIRCALPETTSYGIGFVEGAFRNSKAIGNTVINFRFAIEIHEAVSDVRNCSFISQWNLVISNNIFNRCTTFIYIRRDANTTTSPIYAYSLFANNQFIEVNTTLGTPSVIATSNADGKEIKHMILVNNTFFGIPSGNMLQLGCPLSFLIMGNNFFGSSVINRGNAGSVSPNDNCWEFNTIGYSLTGTSPIPSLYGGTDAPETPVVGQLYYDSGTLKVWNGTEWVGVTA